MQDLKEWTVQFVKHKDVFTKSIVSIDDSGPNIKVKYKDKEISYVVADDLSMALEKISENMSIVTLNTKNNLNELIKNWHQLVKYPELTIYFVNINSASEIKWIIRPYLHNKISDDETLASGLKSLFSTVDEL